MYKVNFGLCKHIFTQIQTIARNRAGMEDKDLQLNFAEFCFDHFQHDTPKDEQYKTPLGSKDCSPNGNDSESIEVVETPSNTYQGPLQESTISSASTNNTDICVLDSHYTNEDLEIFADDDKDIEHSDIDNEFLESEQGDEDFLGSVDVIDKNEHFTVLQKPSKSRRLCDCEESTEVLMLINSEFRGKRKPTYSATDSDVEVLMSEEIVESDWSSGNNLEDSPKNGTLTKENSTDFKADLISEDEVTSAFGPQQFYEDNSLKTQPSTDFEVSSEDIPDIDVTYDRYQNLNRLQLLQLIQKQELSIQALEATVERYQKAQQRLFEHVDALRLELNEIRISPLQNIEEPKNV